MNGIIALVVGASAGLLGALCGVGGGIVLVPAFVMALGSGHRRGIGRRCLFRHGADEIDEQRDPDPDLRGGGHRLRYQDALLHQSVSASTRNRTGHQARLGLLAPCMIY